MYVFVSDSFWKIKSGLKLNMHQNKGPIDTDLVGYAKLLRRSTTRAQYISSLFPGQPGGGQENLREEKQILTLMLF